MNGCKINLAMRQIKINPSVTVRTRTVEEYLRDLNSLKMVTPEEESELSARIQAGDDDALRRLVEANLRFVVSVAKQYQNRGLELTDLISEGNIGLMKAALKFGSTKGFKFISYAVWWIRQQIIQALSDQGRMIRLPLNKVGILNKINHARSEFLQENEREPTEKELSALLDISSEMLLDSGISTLSLDMPLGDEDSGTMMDIIPDSSVPETDRSMEVESLRNDLLTVMSVLNGRERKVLELNYGIGCQPLSLEEISLSMDLSRERVRQLKMRAISKLSSPKVRSRLCQYL